MSRISDFYKKHLARRLKYWIVLILFFAVTFIIGDGSLYNRCQNNERIRYLEFEINRYKKEIEQNSQKTQELQHDREGLERFAREEYLMKQEDEDIYIIKE
jgi:cell division protein FtsB